MNNTSSFNAFSTKTSTHKEDTSMNISSRLDKFYSKVFDVFQTLSISEDKRKIIKENIQKLKKQKVHIMVTGATGCGKSSTINAICSLDEAIVQEVAKVGVNVDPETMNIVKYEIGNLVVYDTPGLGDGKADKQHAHRIIEKLNEYDSQGNSVIDLVLVILDGGSRDLGTSYELINNIIIPNLGKNKEKRILVAINQADQVMHGRYWNQAKCLPEPELLKELEKKCESVHKRILDATGVDIDPIYYSAGFKEKGLPQERGYNLDKLLYYILEHLPAEKRILAVAAANKENIKRGSSEPGSNYQERISHSTTESVTTCISRAVAGVIIGSPFGLVGSLICATVGFFSSFFGW